MRVANDELILWAGAYRWRRSGIALTFAYSRPLWEQPLRSGGYGIPCAATTDAASAQASGEEKATVLPVDEPARGNLR